MEENISKKSLDIHTTDILGRTPLHLVPILSGVDDSELVSFDVNQASDAAWLIIHGLSVNVKDKADKTPLDYAQETKEKLPKVHEVLQAGKVKEEFEQKYKPDPNGIYSSVYMQEVYPKGEVDAWCNAMVVIAKNLRSQE